MKTRITRLFSLLAAVGLIVIIGLPVFAGGGLGDLYYPLTPGYVYDMTELPEEDSPNVSISLFAPDKDLLNVKGGVASVTGRGNLATLNLGMTGVKLTSRHYEVFVTLIAWTTTANGNIIKTSKSMEMKLHEPGIEARDEQLGTALIKP